MKRFHTLVLILALMFAFTASAFAQDRACGDLSAEDCDILYSASEAMMGVTSGRQFVDIEFSATNVPQTPYEELAFDWTLESTYDYSEEAASAAMSFQEMSPQEIADTYADPEALTDLVTTILAGTSTSIDMTTNFSEELAGLLGMSAGAAWPSSVVLNLIMDNGTVYLDLSTLEALMGDAGMGMSGWIGVDILPLVEMSLMQTATDPNTAMAASASTQTGSGPLYTQLAAADPTGVITPFLNIERVDGEEDTATFVTSVDWEAFVASPFFEQLITLALMQGGTGTIPSPAEVEQTVTLSRMFGPTLLQGITLELVEEIDLETDYLVASDFTFDWDLSDLAALAEMSGAAGLEVGEDAAILLSIVTESTDLNEEVDIEVPADALVLPAEALMGAAGGQ